MKNSCSIVHFEESNIFVCVRLVAEKVRNSNLIVWCDNMSVVNPFKVCVRIVRLYSAL